MELTSAQKQDLELAFQSFLNELDKMIAINQAEKQKRKFLHNVSDWVYIDNNPKLYQIRSRFMPDTDKAPQEPHYAITGIYYPIEQSRISKELV